jgi:uncharacterized protein (TIGR04255 family)
MMGLYWSLIRDRYPGQAVKPPIPPVIEEPSPRPDAGASSGDLDLFIPGEPEARFWLIDASSRQLIQVQRNRFIRNWRNGERESSTASDYPRYHDLRAKFEQEWIIFLAFLSQEGLPNPDVNQCEVTYVNQIPLEQGSGNLAEADRILTIFGRPQVAAFLPPPEVLAANVSYLMPERRGRLHVSAQPAVRRKSGKRVLQLTLTARGAPASARTPDLLAWLDLGHEWALNAFLELTTSEMHSLWGLR